ncbi:hypothetical protein FKM82_014758 [Ascaphus truei]
MGRCLSLLFTFSFSTCLCQGVVVTQVTKLLMVHSGDPVKLHCEHDDTTGTYNMFWYQQKSREGLKLIAMSTGINDFTIEKEYETKWSLERLKVTESLLRRKEAETQDSAVYFCASSQHSHKDLRSSPHKTCSSVVVHTVGRREKTDR